MGANDRQKSDAPAQRDAFTPFIENAISDLTLLFVKMVTTPFAFILFTRDFQQQAEALAKEDTDRSFSGRIARPLSFYVFWVAVHCACAAIYWRYEFGEQNIRWEKIPEHMKRLKEILDALGGYIGKVPALAMLAISAISLIATKASVIVGAGYCLRGPMRFNTVLQASAYTFGTFVAIQYFIILGIAMADLQFGRVWPSVGRYVLVYSSAALAVCLVVRAVQMIALMDRVPRRQVYLNWLAGTSVWHLFLMYVAWRLFATDEPFNLIKAWGYLLKLFLPQL